MGKHKRRDVRGKRWMIRETHALDHLSREAKTFCINEQEQTKFWDK